MGYSRLPANHPSHEKSQSPSLPPIISYQDFVDAREASHISLVTVNAILCNAQLSNLPEELLGRELMTLRNLQLSHNSIKWASFSMLDAPGLTEINLSHNKLVTPPEALVGIGTLTKFEHLLKLDLSNNSLNTFPSHPYLPALQVLDV